MKKNGYIKFLEEHPEIEKKWFEPYMFDTDNYLKYIKSRAHVTDDEEARKLLLLKEKNPILNDDQFFRIFGHKTIPIRIKEDK